MMSLNLLSCPGRSDVSSRRKQNFRPRLCDPVDAAALRMSALGRRWWLEARVFRSGLRRGNE